MVAASSFDDEEITLSTHRNYAKYCKKLQNTTKFQEILQNMLF
jgi:ligand-binding sensor protein